MLWAQSSWLVSRGSFTPLQIQRLGLREHCSICYKINVSITGWNVTQGLLAEESSPICFFQIFFPKIGEPKFYIRERCWSPVEQDSLENCCGVIVTVGSNPTLSAFWGSGSVGRAFIPRTDEATGSESRLLHRFFQSSMIGANFGPARDRFSTIWGAIARNPVLLKIYRRDAGVG